MTLDEMLAEARTLNDGDLEVLIQTLNREQTERKNKERKLAWAQVCSAIAHYTAQFGCIRVADVNDDEEICLYHGQFAFSEYGDIEVGA